ncbi:MAG TPA: hypothetical protein VK476_06005, partial [Flavobacterium sp.]|nr:hypothetical protein [Flavobacterium sp.]
IVSIATSENDSRDKEVLLNDMTSMLLKNINFDSLLRQFPASDFCRINKKEIIAMKAVKFFSHNEITLNQPLKNGKFPTVILSEIYRSDFLSKTKI